MSELLASNEEIEENIELDLEHEFAEWTEPDSFQISLTNSDRGLYGEETTNSIYSSFIQGNDIDESINIKGIFDGTFFDSLQSWVFYYNIKWDSFLFPYSLLSQIIHHKERHHFDIEKIIIAAINPSNEIHSTINPYDNMITVVMIVNYIRSRMQETGEV